MLHQQKKSTPRIAFAPLFWLKELKPDHLIAWLQSKSPEVKRKFQNFTFENALKRAMSSVSIPSHSHILKSKLLASMKNFSEPDDYQRTFRRRQVLETFVWGFASSVVIMFAGINPANALPYELSKAVSKVPTFGPPDILYPTYFQGDWMVERDLFSVKEFPGSEKIQSEVDKYKSKVGSKFKYEASFFESHGNIVSDRKYTTCNMMSSFSNQKNLSCSWNPENPNIQTIERTNDGTTREIKVTKRSFTNEPGGEGTFESSEYARVADVGATSLVGTGAPPQLYAIRTLNQYQITGPGKISFIEANFYYDAFARDANAKPILIVKYKGEMTSIEEY